MSFSNDTDSKDFQHISHFQASLTLKVIKNVVGTTRQSPQPDCQVSPDFICRPPTRSDVASDYLDHVRRDLQSKHDKFKTETLHERNKFMHAFVSAQPNECLQNKIRNKFMFNVKNIRVHNMSVFLAKYLRVINQLRSPFNR